jgi:hypothetical protein
MFASGAFRVLRRKLDPRTLNGGVFLGLNGVVVKSHGGADALGFASAIDLAIDMGGSDMIARILKDRAGVSTEPDQTGPLPKIPTAPPRKRRSSRDSDPFCCTWLRRVSAFDQSSPTKILAKRVDTHDEWIVERTGIKRRYMAAPGETTPILLLKQPSARLPRPSEADSIDVIVVATTTPDETFPSTATKVQARLGMKGVPLSTSRRCVRASFTRLSVADNFIRGGQAKTGARHRRRNHVAHSRLERPHTCVLFGDGAGAVVLRGRRGRAQCRPRHL